VKKRRCADQNRRVERAFCWGANAARLVRESGRCGEERNLCDDTALCKVELALSREHSCLGQHIPVTADRKDTDAFKHKTAHMHTRTTFVGLSQHSGAAWGRSSLDELIRARLDAKNVRVFVRIPPHLRGCIAEVQRAYLHVVDFVQRPRNLRSEKATL
jgi:hypothetical protein